MRLPSNTLLVLYKISTELILISVHRESKILKTYDMGKLAIIE